jgi:hypothetical protein
MAMLNNKKTAAAAAGTEVGQLYQKFGANVDTLQLARAMKLDQSINAMQAIQQRGLSKEDAVTANETIARLALERDNIMGYIARKDYDSASNEEKNLKMAEYNRQRAAAAGQRPPSPKEAVELEGKVLDNAKKRQELEGGAGVYGLRPMGNAKPNQHATEKAQDLAANFNALDATLQELRTVALKGASASPTERAKARGTISVLKGLYNSTLGDGTAPNEAQIKAMDDMFVNPREVNVADAAKIYDHLASTSRSIYRAKARGYGFEPDNVDVRPE